MGQYQAHPTASAPGSPLHTATPLSLQRSASIKAKTRKPLPYNPATHPPSLPPAPLSPEMRTVDLPLMTPTRTRSREDESRRPSLPGVREFSGAQGFLLDFDDSSGSSRLSTAVVANGGDDTALHKQNGIDGVRAEEAKKADDEDDIPLETEEDVKEAKVNRKVSEGLSQWPMIWQLINQIADLEITNASLLAINRSLEGERHRP